MGGEESEWVGEKAEEKAEEGEGEKEEGTVSERRRGGKVDPHTHQRVSQREGEMWQDGHVQQGAVLP